MNSSPQGKHRSTHALVLRLSKYEVAQNSWRDWYGAAVVELNSSLTQIRVNEALAAINARASDGHWVPRDGRIDMDEARSTLRGLKSRQEVTRTRAWHVRTRDLDQIEGRTE